MMMQIERNQVCLFCRDVEYLLYCCCKYTANFSLFQKYDLIKYQIVYYIRSNTLFP